MLARWLNDSTGLVCLVLPRRLLSRTREDLLRGKLVETTANRLLVVLPAHAGVVVDEGALAEGIRGSGGLGREAAAAGLGS